MPIHAGFDAKRMSLEEDLTVLIDHTQYQTNLNRVRRQSEDVNNSTLGRQGPVQPIPPPPHGNYNPHDNHNSPNHQNHGTEIEIIVEPCNNKDKCDHEYHEHPRVCADPENEVYQKCGNKCVLGCRYATSSSGITISKHDCEKNDCVEGCFCKTGLVRHQTKCIPASECPIRKCQKNEVYVSVLQHNFD